MNKLILLMLMLFFAQFSWAHGQAEHNATGQLAISTVFDQTGQLWRVHIKEGFVLVSHSNDIGKTFSKPVKVNAEAQQMSAHGEVRPKIAIGKAGEIYVTWVQSLKARFSGYVWFARSTNGGKTFEKPLIVHQDRAEIGHGFEEINVAPNGDVTVLWLDARDLVAAKQAGLKRSGSSIYYAVSSDAGNTFAQEKKLADNSCECCRITTTSKPDGAVVAMWRHVFEGSERDHNIAEIPKAGAKPELHRATFGHWVIDGCPHHGAALASGGEGANWWGYHMAYFDGNDANIKSGPGLYYSRMDGVAWVASPPKKFGDNSKQAGHPSLLSMSQKKGDEHVWLVWREIKDGKSSILGMHSEDGGRSWNDAKTLASTSQKADYPFLLQHKNTAYLTWNTQENGLQVIALVK
jgi:hypothetical protein